MRPVLVLRHGDEIPVGLLGDSLRTAGVPWDEVMLHADEPIPELSDFSALVVLGGVMSAFDDERYPWLVDERRAIGAAHAADMPMLGICLGSQLFAAMLGARAYTAPSGPEIGYLAPSLTPEGRSDSVLRHFDVPAVVFHQDTWDLPPGASLLAESDRFPHAFRLGAAVGIQAHPEADASILGRWLEIPEEQAQLEAAGVDPAELLAVVEAGASAGREMAGRLFGAWVEEVEQRLDI